MPSRNVLKVNVPDAYYHVYARGINKENLFLESRDYKYFLGLFERYLSRKPAVNRMGVVYPHFYGKIELLTYCLMQNHFHLLIYQVEAGAMEKLMRSIMTSYSRYFNLKYKRTGSLYESRYKASLIDQETYLQHISRYIHLNPRGWQTYRYSSLRYYKLDDLPEWLKPTKVLDLFDSSDEYMEFVQAT
jgi:putative transposase